MNARARTTAQAILDNYAKTRDRRSNGIGISTLGEECERKLWYDFRWCGDGEKFDGRMRRLLDTGKREEERIIADLHAIGCEVHGADPETDKQFRVEALGGHVSGYLDAVVKNIPEDPSQYYTGEFKTHNANNFDKLRAKGVEKSHPKHFAQCQLGAHLEGLPGTLYVAQCKDTDDMYSELVPLNPKKAQALLDKAERIVFAKEPPAKLKDSPDYPPCSWCTHRDRCHYSTPARPVLPLKTCRSCIHATPERDGSWSCGKHGWKLDKERQEKGCDDGHLFIPELLPFGDPVHVDAEWGFALYSGQRVNVAGTGKIDVERVTD